MTRQAYAVANQSEKFVDAVLLGKKENAAFDAAEDHVLADAPELLQDLGAAVGSPRKIVNAVMDGVAAYTANNGVAPDGGVIATAIQNAMMAASPAYRRSMGVDRKAAWDSVSNVSDSPMVQNAAQLAVYQTLSEAVPFGGYIPMENGLIGKLIIAGHYTASKTGSYEMGASLDGINGGNPFLSSMRTAAAVDGGAQTDYTAKILYADGDSAGSPVVASSIQVFVSGLPAVHAPVKAGRNDATVRLAGDVSLPVNGVMKSYGVSGTLTVQTGEVALTFTPALETSHEVTVSAAIDYEHTSMLDKRPRVRSDAQDYELTAHVTSGIYMASQESVVQWNKEARLDPEVEATYALRQQAAAERHFAAVRAMYAVGKNFTETYALQTGQFRNRNDAFEDASFALTAADQAMIERTNAFGIGVVYVGSRGKAYLESLSAPLFVKSGVASAPGIHRIGTLFGKYQVFYCPNVLKESASAIEMLCIGRASQIGLNPYVIGDVTGAVIMDIAANQSLQTGVGYFQAGLNTVNPHAPAAMGAAVVQFTNMI